ncbi:MAG: hypothetical protein IJG64_00615 [Oscillospiraceae bacterium]|nr:hypothetical protein [Oscillospiraceae bacterium]
MANQAVNWENDNVLWGLTDGNTEEEIRLKAWELIKKQSFIPTATVSDGSPEIRIIDFNLLPDGNLYFMTSKGKPFYRQLCERPEIAINTAIDSLYSLKLKAWVKEIPNTDKWVWDEFFKLNPGTVKMYRKNFDIVAVFRLEKGDGEMFHLYAEEKIRRVRFGFGGGAARPLTYRITDECIGCQSCLENCVEEAIHVGEDGKCYIRYMDCDDCGICYTKCPMPGVAMISRIE